MYLVLKVLNNVLSYWTSDFSRYCKIKNNFLFVCVCVCFMYYLCEKYHKPKNKIINLSQYCTI